MIFILVLLLALLVLGVGVTAVPIYLAVIPLGAGLSLFLLDVALVLPWYTSGRRQDRLRAHVTQIVEETAKDWPLRWAVPGRTPPGTLHLGDPLSHDPIYRDDPEDPQ